MTNATRKVAALLTVMAASAGCGGADHQPPRGEETTQHRVLADAAAPLPAAPGPAGLPPDASVATRPGVPVLVFHGVCPNACASDNPYGISQAELSATLGALAAEGYVALSMDAYARWFAGDSSALPSRPILLTFDDGRSDAYVGADTSLHWFGMRATMFVITGRAQASAPGFMSWRDIGEAAASGRWDIQLHANAGHVLINVGRDATGVSLKQPFYACLRDDGDAGMETFEAWRIRAESDIASGDALLAAHVPGYRSQAFAVPYGDYGQTQSNDPHIAPALRAFFDGRWDAWFTQPSPDPEPTPPHAAGATREAARFTVKSTTTSADVMAWLGRHPR